jgi:DNA-binding transcriptional MerR regulator
LNFAQRTTDNGQRTTDKKVLDTDVAPGFRVSSVERFVDCRFKISNKIGSTFGGQLAIGNVMRGTAMKEKRERFFQANEFAKRAGVTVRALHHYDRLGLLRPTSYTQAGYRLYSEKSFVRLQQIVTLKFIGFSLKEIKEILNCDSFDLASALQTQRNVLKAKHRYIDLAIKAIEKAEETLSSKDETDLEAFAKIVEVITMEDNMDWTKKYYSEEAQAKIEERKKLWTPELQEQVTRDWNNLFKDIEEASATGEDPASEKSQSFVARWDTLLRGFTGGDPEIQKGLNKLYADQANWPANAGFKKYWNDEVEEFISKARASKK